MGNPISREVFLERAVSRFGDWYDYSDVVYKSYKSPVKIKCNAHPVRQITITPERHLQTTGGCKYCLRERRINILERGLAMPAAAEVAINFEAKAREITPLVMPLPDNVLS